MPFQYACIAFISTSLFFLGSEYCIKTWIHSECRFLQLIFYCGFGLRLIWVLYCYLYFNELYYGQSYGDSADCEWYMNFAKNIVLWIENGCLNTFDEVRIQNRSAIDDIGYPIWLSIQYLIIGIENDTFIPFLVKCVVSSYCSVIIYKISKRHFGIWVARVTSIFLMFNPNMIYWCGTMFKEPEMLYISCLFINKTDELLYEKQHLSLKNVLIPIFLGLYLFCFRSVLAYIGFASIFLHLLLSSNYLLTKSKKYILIFSFTIVLALTFGDVLLKQSEVLIDMVQSDSQESNMNYRSYREGGNLYAKYAGAIVFAPLIFSLPFPTFNVASEAQILQLQLSGGSYIKNILSFLVIYILFQLVKSAKWKQHVLLLSYMCGYLIALVLSNFAHSGRFHLPIIPFIIMFGVYGFTVFFRKRNDKKLWTMILIFELIICFAWNMFKLVGRGLL